jgi:hypothetical protein
MTGVLFMINLPIRCLYNKPILTHFPPERYDPGKGERFKGKTENRE